MRNFKFYQHLLQVLVVVAACTLSSENNQCQAIRLNSNGGYDIVIGVETNVIEPLNVQHFLEDIRSGVQEFSQELWKATKRRFYINSVDVLVPGNWWTISNFDTATWQTVLDSEIRLSHDVGAPTSVNPNACGTPGLYVELPDNFFKVPLGGKFGPIGKALTNLWARYRYGVWEEHGIPGDTRFPYFYAHPSFEPKWEATGCSNEKLSGSFRNIDGEVSDRCSPYNSDGPDDDCRFIPSHSNAANSSLMQFHWLESVSEFCDSKTHNHAAPNRQNLFCGHRSIWEVIRESDDYKSTTTCTDTFNPPTFRVMKENRSPELYILLDRGNTVTPEKVLQEVMAALTNFVGFPTLERVNIAVGTYPHANQGRNHYYVKEEVGWAPISTVFYDIERILNASSVPDGPVIRDFGLAIQEVAQKIKQRNHLAGTVILVVKRGASPNMFDKISFEQEVIASIKEDSRIKVFAIEAQQGEKTPFTNLQTLAEATSGQYHLINDTMHTAKKLEPILAAITEKLEQSSIMNSQSTWTIQKEYTEAHKTIEIPIHDNANIVKVYLTTHHAMAATDIYLERLVGEPAIVKEDVKGEWDENHDLSKRIVFTYTINNPGPGAIYSIKHGCHTEKSAECRFFLVVTVNNDSPTPRVGVDDFIFNSQSISIDVSTSATETNYVDMSHQNLRLVPFAIYAKIEMEQQRVLNLENVTALVRLGGEHDNHLGDWIVPLTDDGLGLPDIAKHDGIYSGIFTPLENGLYQISVAASGISQPGGSPFQNIRIVNHAGSLMQVDQLSFGCKNSSKPRCASAVPRGSFSRVQDMRSTVFVENAGTFKPGKPTRILDFTVTALPDFKVELEFTSPQLLGSDDHPEEFRLYMAPHVDNFIGSTDMTKLLEQWRGEPSGSRVKLIHQASTEQGIPFYAVEAVYKGQSGGPSNVVGVVPNEYGPIVPSPTTTPPPSTTSGLPTSSGPTTTTEFPWPSTTPTTESPFPTTTDESDEDYSDETSTVGPPITSTDGSEITTTNAPTTSAPTTSVPPIITESTEPVSSTTAGPTTEVSDVASTSTLSPTGESDITGPISTTTVAPSSTTTEDSEVTSTSTNSPTITTEGSEVSGPISSTTPVPISTTENEDATSTTEAVITTTENAGITGIASSTTTTQAPISTTENEDVTGIISSTTTAVPSTTTENGGITGIGSSTTQAPTTTTENGDVTSTTTEVPVSTTDNGGIISSSTTQAPISTTENEEVTATSSTTQAPIISTTENEEVTATTSSTTTQAPISTTENEEVSSTSTTTEVPISTTENEGVTGTSSTTTQAPITTTENEEGTSTSTSTPEVSTSTTENGVVTSTTSTTETPISTTQDSEVPSTSTTVSPVTSTEGSVSTTESSVSTTTTNPEVTSTSTASSSTTSTSTTEQVATSTIPPTISTESTQSTSESSSPPDEDVTVTISPSTPPPASPSMSTSSDQASTQITPITESSSSPVSASVKLSFSSFQTIIYILTLIYFQL